MGPSHNGTIRNFDYEYSMSGVFLQRLESISNQRFRGGIAEFCAQTCDLGCVFQARRADIEQRIFLYFHRDFQSCHTRYFAAVDFKSQLVCIFKVIDIPIRVIFQSWLPPYSDGFLSGCNCFRFRENAIFKPIV